MRRIIGLLGFLWFFPSVALAGFALLIPSDDILSPGEPPSLVLQVRLFEPLSRRFVELPKPARFGMQQLGEQTDLRTALKPDQERETAAWRGELAVKRPGDVTVYAELAPRWEAADDQFLVHHVKLCINSLGLEEGWDEPVGLEAEIVPLSRPYALWSGNLFSGQVLMDGEPAPYAAIEVTWLGTQADMPSAMPVPATAYHVQKLRADSNGVFHYAMPIAGWWGFAATLDADWTIKRGGEEKPVALVTSFWVLTRDMK